MAPLAQRDQERIDKAFLRAKERIEALKAANVNRPSDLRDESIAYLESFTEQIEDMGFYLKFNFDQDEIDALFEAAAELEAAEDSLVDTDVFTRQELESDLASLLHDILTGSYLRMLKSSWVSERRRYKWMPATVPKEVVDDFDVLMFNRTQGALNFAAHQIEKVAAVGCLNSEDYSTLRFETIKLEVASYAARDAIATYVTLQQLQAAARAAQAKDELSVAGKIWAIVGWDDPWDFTVDVGLTIVTGGASKFIKWGQRVAKLSKRATKVVTRLERVLEIETRIKRLEERALTVRRTAKRLKKAGKWARVPEELMELLLRLKRLEQRNATLKLLGDQVRKDILRSVAASITSKSMVSASSTRGSALGKAAVLAAVWAQLDGSLLGAEIKEARSKVNYVLLIKDGPSAKELDRFFAYLGLLTARQLIARWIYSGAHTRTIAPGRFAEQLAKDVVDSFVAALEMMVRDLPFLKEAGIGEKWVHTTVMSSIGKTIAEYGKLLVGMVFK